MKVRTIKNHSKQREDEGENLALELTIFTLLKYSFDEILCRQKFVDKMCCRRKFQSTNKIGLQLNFLIENGGNSYIMFHTLIYSIQKYFQKWKKKILIFIRWIIKYSLCRVVVNFLFIDFQHMFLFFKYSYIYSCFFT
jgi:hypothetical protein